MNDYTFIPNAEHFQKIRQKTIGSSDIPVICGLSKYETPYSLWRKKTGRDELFSGNSITKWGHRHEPNIIASYIEENYDEEMAENFLIDYFLYLRRKNITYISITPFRAFTEFFHPDIKWAMAHPDCLNIQDNYIIEAKSHKNYVYDYDDIPVNEFLQIQWQLLCTGLNDAVLRALVNTNEEFTFPIKSNKKIQEKLIDVASRFMFCIEKDKEPMPSNSDDIKLLFPEVKNEARYLPPIESEYANKMIDRKKFLSDKIRKYEDEVKDINDGLMLLIGDDKYLYNQEGEKLCSQTMFDRESLSIKDLPENIYSELKNSGIIKTNSIRFIK